ncbi:hypothetical protein [Streptomyces erythrochromogenes]|uniref:hypothetical protein n=1 Tax=Streptomyces erythrochromogenes TaxID=285574 RepID=UPI00386B12C1|nr:hypothetical protein OG489_01685 [Streptomyces erythrochromogenes]
MTPAGRAPAGGVVGRRPAGGALRSDALRSDGRMDAEGGVAVMIQPSSPEHVIGILMDAYGLYCSGTAQV